MDLTFEVESAGRIKTLPTILEVVCRTTGMGFAALARVTEDGWIACGVRDEIDFGLRPGGELEVETTICNGIQQGREPVVINHVAKGARWYRHPMPAMYGFQSYISVPIVLEDGSFFGTLCAIAPRPAQVETPEVIWRGQLCPGQNAPGRPAHDLLAGVGESSERATDLTRQLLA